MRSKPLKKYGKILQSSSSDEKDHSITTRARFSCNSTLTCSPPPPILEVRVSIYQLLIYFYHSMTLAQEMLPQLQLPGGMRRAISWSKIGFITYALASPGTHNLFLTYLENYDGKNWQLARPQGLTVKPLDDSAAPQLHVVQWSNLLTDLAIFDEHGNFYVLLAGVGLLPKKEHKEQNGKETNGQTNGTDDDGPSYELTSYNHTEMIFRDIVPKPGPAHARCVSFKWLGIDKSQVVNKPAVWSENKYSYSVQQIQPLIAHPVATKQACVALRQNGTFQLYYQGEHKVEYHKIGTDLAPGGEVYFTHGCIGFSADKKILVIAYDALSRRVLTYTVAVNWGYLVELAGRQRGDPHYHTPKDAQTPPSLTVVLAHEMPRGPDVLCELGETHSTIERAELVLIDILPPSHTKLLQLDILISYEVFSGSTPYTTMLRYHLQDRAAQLGEAFTGLGAEEAPRAGLLSLVLQDRFSASKQIHHIETAVSDSLVLLIYTDGSVDAIDRSNWAIVVPEKKLVLPQSRPATITSLLDGGFLFPDISFLAGPKISIGTGVLLYAVSPNMAAIVYGQMGNESGGSELRLRVLDRPESSTVELTSTVLAHSHACACYSNSSSDDLIALVRSEFFKSDTHRFERLPELFVEESHRAINFQVNSFGKDSVDKILLNPPLQKLLSLQLIVGELHSKRSMRDMAWIVLNLRSTSFGIMFTLSSIYRNMSRKKPVEDSLADSIVRAECIMLLVGSVQWLIDLIVYLNQELLQLAFTRSRPGASRVTVTNSVVLPIILSKVPRLFLMYALSSIGKTHEILKKLHKDLGESNKLFTPMKDALNRFFTACNLLPLNLGIFEGFLRECEVYVAKEMGRDRDPLQLEQQLFCQGVISDDLVTIANALVDRHTMSISRDLKLSEMYFYKNDWVDVGIAVCDHYEYPLSKEEEEDPIKRTIPRLQCSQNECVDALRKVVIRTAPGLVPQRVLRTTNGYHFDKTRKCTRCRSVSLVADPLVFDGPGTIGLWTMVFQRTCICGSPWVNCSPS